MGFDSHRPPSDVNSCFGGFVFDEQGCWEGGYEGGSFGDDGRSWGVSALARGAYNELTMSKYGAWRVMRVCVCVRVCDCVCLGSWAVGTSLADRQNNSFAFLSVCLV